jgi:RNA polymerase sigma-70 factor (ECF subfamily)
MLRRDPFASPEPLIKRVYAYVAYRVGDGADAEDITSATFERGLRYKKSFDAGKGDATAWLIGIARREIAGHFAARPDAGLVLPEFALPGDLAADSADRMDLQAAVSELDPRDRELIALRYGADLSARQIAELLELKTNAVEVALHRALGRLRDRLEERPAEQRGAPGYTRRSAAL